MCVNYVNLTELLNCSTVNEIFDKELQVMVIFKKKSILKIDSDKFVFTSVHVLIVILIGFLKPSSGNCHCLAFCAPTCARSHKLLY